MVIEHSFVTTLEGRDALTRAAEFLGQSGFVAKKNSGFALDAGNWTELEMVRGRVGASDPVPCFQTIRLEFDRGRVTVAAAIIPIRTRQALRLSLGAASSSLEIKPDSRAGRPYAELMVAAAQSLDNLLARKLPADEARMAWHQKDTALAAILRKQRRNQRILNIVRLALVVAVIGFVFYIVTHAR